MIERDKRQNADFGNEREILYKVLFDMKNDPWETKNLSDQSDYAPIVADHRKLLSDFEAPFELAPIRPPANRKPQKRPTRAKPA